MFMSSVNDQPRRLQPVACRSNQRLDRDDRGGGGLTSQCARSSTSAFRSLNHSPGCGNVKNPAPFSHTLHSPFELGDGLSLKASGALRLLL